MRYLISGVNPNDNGGSSHLLKELLKSWQRKGVFIYSPRRPPLQPLLKNRDILGMLFYPFVFLFYFCRSLKFGNLKNASVLIYHPQSLGYQRCISLIENNYEIFYYVLD